MEKPNALLLHPQDNVAVVLEDIMPGVRVSFERNGVVTALCAAEHIPVYHKVSVALIENDGLLYKYGQVIGRSICGIQPGQHVHTHNLISIRENIG